MKKISLIFAVAVISPLFAFADEATTTEPIIIEPVVVEQKISKDSGMPWCSSPMAPGWNVSLPNGGCSNTQSVSLGGLNPTQTEVIKLQMKLVELLKQLIALLSK